MLNFQCLVADLDLLTNVVVAPAPLQEEATDRFALGSIASSLFLPFLSIFENLSVVRTYALIAVLAERLSRIVRIV